MDKGGKREGAGRKPKATEMELIELLTPLDKIALEALKKGLLTGQYQYLKLYFEYRYGKPNQKVEINNPKIGFDADTYI